MDRFKRKVCCCEIFVKEAALRRLTKLIVLADIVLLVIWIAVYILLIYYAAQEQGFTTDKGKFLSTIGKNNGSKIFTSLAIVILPLFVTLCFKTYRGFYWLEKDSGRNSFLRYFNVSWVYFLAQDVDFILIGITSTQVFGYESYLIMLLMVGLSVPVMIALYL